QEALTNVLRHAGAGARVQLALDYTGDRIRVSVVDDGGAGPVLGPAPAARTVRSPSTGHGLIGMRERVNVHGGELTAGPSGRGWAVDATIPVRAAVAA